MSAEVPPHRADPDEPAGPQQGSIDAPLEAADVDDLPTAEPPVVAPREPVTTPLPPSTRVRDSAPAAPRSASPRRVTPYPLFGDPPTEMGAKPARSALSPHLTPKMTAIFGGLFGLACVTSIVALLIQVVPTEGARRAAASASAAASGAASARAPIAPEARRKKRVAIPGPWRIAELDKDPSIAIERGTIDKKSFVDALNEKNVPVAQVYRIMKAFDGVRNFDKSNRKDKFTVALEKATKRVKAFEFEVSPSEVYQAREGAEGLLAGSKLDMKIAEEEVSGAFYMSGDANAAATWGGFDDGLVAAVDEAFNGRISHETFEEGSVVKVIAVEETALGLFSHYKRIIAAEYRPVDPGATPTRTYSFTGQEAHGMFDDKGKQPYSGGWQSPIAGGAIVTSPFNPHRMHPVLHKLMPHEGTDLRAPTGTPIYSAYHGVVESAGPLGPCGNAVVLMHPNGIETGYCHMSRIAPELKAGDHVGGHQLIGFAGQTGRATGPHLHFFAKKDGKFFDAMTLHLNGERVLPPGDRGAFAVAKAELDRRLDAIPMPEPPPETPKPTAAAANSAEAAPASSADKAVADRAEKSDGKARTARQIASPAALASAAAAPGIHPSTLVEDDADDDGQ